MSRRGHMGHRLRRVAAWGGAVLWVALFAAVVPLFPGQPAVAILPAVLVLALWRVEG